MVTIPANAGGVYPPSIQRLTSNPGIASLAAELATLPTPAIAEQIIGLAAAPPAVADLAAGRFAAAAVELARRTLQPPPRRRVSSAELGRRLIDAVERHNPYGRAADARISCLMLEWLDGNDRITPAGRRALRKLEGQP